MKGGGGANQKNKVEAAINMRANIQGFNFIAAGALQPRLVPVRYRWFLILFFFSQNLHLGGDLERTPWKQINKRSLPVAFLFYFQSPLVFS